MDTLKYLLHYANASKNLFFFSLSLEYFPPLFTLHKNSNNTHRFASNGLLPTDDDEKIREKNDDKKPLPLADTVPTVGAAN